MSETYKYGEFQNVQLSLDEYEKLLKRFGEIETQNLIEHLSRGIASKGYRYKSHYATIINWAKASGRKTVKVPPPGELESPEVIEQGEFEGKVSSFHPSNIPRDPEQMSIKLELADTQIRDKPVWNIQYKPTGGLIGFFCFHQHGGSEERVFVPAPETCFNFPILVNIVDLLLSVLSEEQLLEEKKP